MLKSLCALFITLLLLGCSDSPQLSKLSPNHTILALGDSLTYGTGVSADESYPAVLEQLTGHAVINAGIPGETSTATLLRIEQALLEHQPALVILCIGGNDILKRHSSQIIKHNIQQLITAIQQHGSQLILVAVPEFGLYPSAPEFYSELAAANSLALDEKSIPRMLRDSEYKSDPIHLNQRGYRELAEAIQQLLIKHGAL